MTWLNANAQHFAVPCGMLLALMAIMLSRRGMKVRQAQARGEEFRPLPVWMRAALILFVVLNAIVFGVVLANLSNHA